jgi:hypothetical protein
MVGHPCVERDHRQPVSHCPNPPTHGDPSLGLISHHTPAGGPRTAMRPPHRLYHLKRVRWWVLATPRGTSVTTTYLFRGLVDCRV